MQQQQPVHPALLAAIVVARTLEESRFQQLISALDRETLPFTNGVLQAQRLLQFSAAESRTIVSLLRQWQMWGKDAQALATTLQTARVTRDVIQAESPSIRLVWTGPVSLPGAIRDTGSVLFDLIDHARQEIVIVGYALARSARQVIEHLAQAHQRGVEVILIIDRMEEEPLAVLRECWPRHQKLPLLYTRKASLSDAKSALHAKVVVVDSHTLLTTSANLSYHGLAGNIEMGLLVEGRVAQEAVDLLKSLIVEGICVKVEVEETP